MKAKAKTACLFNVLQVASIRPVPCRILVQPNTAVLLGTNRKVPRYLLGRREELAAFLRNVVKSKDSGFHYASVASIDLR